jgi:hypothetical protein
MFVPTSAKEGDVVGVAVGPLNRHSHDDRGMHSNICWVLAEGFYAEETDLRKLTNLHRGRSDDQTDFPEWSPCDYRCPRLSRYDLLTLGVYLYGGVPRFCPRGSAFVLTPDQQPG